jgi:hypothetical protein
VGGWIKPQPLIFKRKNMAKKFLTGLNLVVLPTDPVTGSEGELYFNSSASVAKIYQAGAWSVLGAGDVDSKSTSSVYLVRNNTGSTILKGTLVSASGAEPSGRIDVEPFAAVGGINSELTVMGMATENISNGVNGEVISFGTLTGIDTRGDTTSAIAVGDETWAAGDILFAHPTVAGKLTKVRPQHDLAVAFITVRHASTGQLAVRVIPGNNHLEWMHDVSITTPLDDQALIYNSSASVWNNASIVNSLTGTENEIEVSSSNGDITIGISASPIFTTPDIGVATATSINGTTIPTDATLLITDDINTTVQGYSSTLNDLAGSTLIGDGFVKSNGVGVWSIDSNEYLTTSSASTNYLTQSSASSTYQPIGSYLTTESDPVFSASDAAGIASGDIDNWDAAYGWGNHASAGYLTSYTESDTLENVTDRGASSTNAITISNTTESTSDTTGALVVSGGLGVGKDVWIHGNLHVNGTTVTENTQTVATHDNLIYLNSAYDSTITNAVFSSGSITYTANNDYVAGMDIRVTGIDPVGFNISSGDGLTVASATSTQFVVIKSDPGASYISGGTSHAKTEANPDLGFAGGYYDAGYAHAGLFRDASDGVFKFFKGYTPEPDEAINIDVGHPSFELADLDVNDITALNAVLSGSVSVGAVVSGTWYGNEIDYFHGGTGLTTIGTAGQILQVNSSGTGLEYNTIDGGTP